MPATLLLSSHSELDPPLPIPNRAVKRLSADDSADYPCESRTLLGSLSAKKPSSRGLFCLCDWCAVEAGKLNPDCFPLEPQQHSVSGCARRPKRTAGGAFGFKPARLLSIRSALSGNSMSRRQISRASSHIPRKRSEVPTLSGLKIQPLRFLQYFQIARYFAKIKALFAAGWSGLYAHFLFVLLK